MALSGDNSKVSLSVEWEGLEKALQDIARLRAEIERLGTPIAGAQSPVQQAGGLPSGAPAGAPQPPDPSSAYRSAQGYQPPTTQGTVPISLSIPPSYGPSPNTAPPGVFAPPAPGTLKALPAPGIDLGHGVTMFPPMSGGPAGVSGGVGTSGPVSAMTIQAQTVVIHATTVTGAVGGGGGVPGVVSGGGGGGSAATFAAAVSGGAGGGAGGGSVPGQPAPSGGSSANPNLDVNNMIGFGAFAAALMRNPTPGGLFNAAMGMLPLGPSAAILTALQFGSTALGAYVAGTGPRFEIESSLAAAPYAGQYYNPRLTSAMRSAADLEGALASARRWGSMFDSIPLVGAIVGSINEMWSYRPMEAEIKKAKAIVESTPLAMRLGAMSGVDVFSGDEFLQYDAAAAQGMAIFGRYAAGGVVRGGQYKALANRGWSASDIGAAYGAIGSLAMRPEMDELRNMIISGGRGGKIDMNELATEYAPMLASMGNFGALAQLQPYIQGKDNYKKLLETASLRLSLEWQQQAAQYAAQGTQAAVAGARGTGAGWEQVSELIGATAGPLQEQVRSLESKRSMALNEADRAQIEAQLAQAKAQLASIPQAQTIEQISAKQTFLGAAQMQAQVGMTRAMYGGGGAGDVYAAYGGLGEVAARRASEYSRFASLPGLTPQERETWRAQAASAQAEAEIMIPRERGQFVVGLGSARLAVAGAGASLLGTQAQLFGGPAEQYSAGMAQVGVIQQQQAFTQWQVSNASALHLSPVEQVQLERQLVDLKREEIAATQQVVRGYYSMQTTIATTEHSIAGIQAGRAAVTGVGGTAMTPYWQQSVSTAHREVSAIDAEIANLRAQPGMSEDNPAMIALRQKREAALTGVEQARGGLASTPMPFEFRMAQQGTEFAFNIMSRTYLPWGNQRGALASLMGYAQQELQTVNDLERRARASGEWQPWMAEGFQTRRLEIGSRMAGYQGQYEAGFMDRLISQVYNAPQSAAFVANRFTALEAAPFMQAMGPAWGFSGTAARDYYRDRYPRLASSLIGMVNRPEGFVETAMSGATGPGRGDWMDAASIISRGQIGFMTGSAVGGSPQSLTITVRVVGEGGKELGRESQRTQIGALGSGAMQIAVPSGAVWGTGAHQ